MTEPEIKKYLQFIEENLHLSGELAMKQFGTIFVHKTKEDPRQVVTDVDLASEKQIIQNILLNFPEHSIIAEESGFTNKKSDYTWIIDPIDGTSNYAKGIPWFGIMIALSFESEVIAAGIYLPVTDEMVIAGLNTGAFYNGKKVKIEKEVTLKKSLVSLCLDGVDAMSSEQFISSLYVLLIKESQNLRCTNSAVDYVYAAIGKLGATINTSNKIWDIAPISLIAKEAGCLVFDIDGQKLKLIQNEITRNYTLLVCNPSIYSQLQNIIVKAKS